MKSSEIPKKRLIVRWTAPKGFAAITLFFVLSLMFEVLLVLSFQMFGLVDYSAWTSTFIIPYANYSLTLTVSPLFHLLPLSVVLVLLTSWAYLTKTTAFISQRIEGIKRGSPSSRRAHESRRFKSLRRLTKRISQRLQRIGRTLKSATQRIRGVSYISQRLHFARKAVRSAVVVLILFLCAAFLMILASYPSLIYSSTLNFYKDNPVLLNFVLGVGNWINGVGSAVPPLGALGSSINNALVGASPGFRHALQGAGEALTGSIVKLDVAGKYVLSQNLAAWVAALIALVYGSYASSRPRRPRGR